MSESVFLRRKVAKQIQDENKHWGVRRLKAYLQYAKFGYSFLQDAEPKGDTCDSEFEEWLLQTLRTNGFDAIPRFGFAGYQIDLAVKHPRKPGIFCAAWNVDGATYHSIIVNVDNEMRFISIT